MKTVLSRQIWMTVLGWAFVPGLCLLIGYFLGRLLSTSTSTRELYQGGQLGLIIGLASGVFIAGILTAGALNPFYQLSATQMGILAGEWLFSFVICILVIGFFYFIAEIVSNIDINIPLPRLTYPLLLILGVIAGSFSMGVAGSIFTTSILKSFEPNLEKKIIKSIAFRWGIGFVVGVLLSGIFFANGIAKFVTSPFASFSSGAIWFAVGFAIIGLCASLIGGHFMLKQFDRRTSERGQDTAG